MRIGRTAVIVSALMAVAMATTVAPARVRTVTQRYEVALYAYADSADDPVGVTEDGRLEWGGVHFDPVAKRGRFSPRFTARDDTDPLGTGFVYISACQDVNGDDLCNNEGGDIRARGCVGPGNRWLTMHGALKKLPIGVIVYAAYPCPDAGQPEGGATTGTVSMRWGK